MKTLNKILDYIEEGLCCLCLVVMTGLTFVNVVSRYVFSASLSFSEEITTYLFVLLSLLGAAIAAKRGAHLGFTLITEHVGEKVGRVLNIVAMAFATAFSGLICYYGVFMVINQFNKGQVTGAMQLPEWIFGAFVPVGALFVTVRFAQNLIRLFTGKNVAREDVLAEAMEAAEEAQKIKGEGNS